MPATLHRLTPAEDLAIERRADVKSELVDGSMVAMTGASRNHNLVAFNLAVLIGNQIAGSDCEAYTGDMRVRIPGTDAYYYPDGVIVCGEPEFEDENEDTLVNPTVIFEIRSPSTAMFDRTIKFSHYARVPSLTDYLLVAQDQARIERFARAGDDWELSVTIGMDAVVDLPTVGCHLPLAQVFQRVALARRPRE